MRGVLAVFDKCIKNKKVKSKNLKENKVPGAATELREELSTTHPLPQEPLPHLTPWMGQTWPVWGHMGHMSCSLNLCCCQEDEG